MSPSIDILRGGNEESVTQFGDTCKRSENEMNNKHNPTPPPTTTTIRPTSPAPLVRRASTPRGRHILVDASLPNEVSGELSTGNQTPTPPSNTRHRTERRSSCPDTPDATSRTVSPQRRESECIPLHSPGRHAPIRSSPLSTTWSGTCDGLTPTRPPHAGSMSADHSSASSSDDMDGLQHNALLQLHRQHARANDADGCSDRSCRKYASTHDVSDVPPVFSIIYDDEASEDGHTDTIYTGVDIGTDTVRTRKLNGKTYASTHGSDSETELGYSSSDNNYSQSSIKPLLSDEPPSEPSIPEHVGVVEGAVAHLQVPQHGYAASRRARSSDDQRGNADNTRVYVPARETLVSQSYSPRANPEEEKSWTSLATVRGGTTAQHAQRVVLDGVDGALSSRPTSAVAGPDSAVRRHRRTHSGDVVWTKALHDAHNSTGEAHRRGSSMRGSGEAPHPRRHRRTGSTTTHVGDGVAVPQARARIRRRSSPAPPRSQDSSAPAPVPFALVGVGSGGSVGSVGGLGAPKPRRRRHSSVHCPPRDSVSRLEPLPPIGSGSVASSARRKLASGAISAEEYAHIARVVNQSAEEEVLTRKLETGVITSEEYEHIKQVAARDPNATSTASEEEEDPTDSAWPVSTLSSGVPGSATLDYIADVSVVPLDAMDEYGDALPMCQRLHGDLLPAGELAVSMGSLRRALSDPTYVMMVMYLCDLADPTGFRSLPRDYRVYPTMLLADTLLVGGGVPDGERRVCAAMSELGVESILYDPKVTALVRRIREYYCMADKLHNGMVGVKRIMAVVAKDPRVDASQRAAFQQIVEKVPQAKNLLKEISLIDYLAVSPLLCVILMNGSEDSTSRNR
eukprot:m.1632267 g.1632267  ORF g.1632267 m.1632267 type:complete len:851 (+) comp25404_c0_seq8:707-3259(+)